MVEDQLVRRGISDPAVLAAFRSVPREHFVPDDLRRHAYSDMSLPIGHDQTISQPYVVALTASALELEGTERVLEIGTGSGYQAAILGQLAWEVFSVERLEALADVAIAKLASQGIENIHVSCHDGTLGWREEAPFNAIAVAAGGPVVPKALLQQLTDGGRLVIPVGPEKSSQLLMRVTRRGDQFVHESLGPVRFVPLIGAQGWTANEPPRRFRGADRPHRDL